MSGFNANQQALDDMMRLNRWRADRLATHAVRDPLADELLGKAEHARDRAVAALAKHDYETYLRTLREAMGYATKAYPLIKALARDTVEGVVFYFVLLIPFAFFLERLLFGVADIRRQIAIVAAIFALIFLVMRWAHPAFRVSDSPYVIFLAYLILALAGIVLVLITSKFNEQVRAMRSAAAGRVHRQDVGRISATVAAVLLGISNLRKRKLRTTLTTATVVLLTFAVLSFTSVTNRTGYYRFPRSTVAGYDGVLIRDRHWRPLSGQFEQFVRSAFADTGLVVPRCWFYMEKLHDLFLPVFGPAQGGESGGARPMVTLAGAVGMTGREDDVSGLWRKCGRAGRWLRAGAYDECVLPSRRPRPADLDAIDLDPQTRGRIQALLERWDRQDGMPWHQVYRQIVSILGEQRAAQLTPYIGLAERLGVDLSRPETATIECFGRRWTVVGLLDQDKLDFRDLDGESFAPVSPRKGPDVRFEQENEQQLEAEDRRRASIPAARHVPAERVAIFNYYGLRECGGQLVSLAIAGEPAALEQTVEALLERTNLLAFVARDGRSRAYSALGITDIGLAGGLVVPVLIASLIILNTMLGSVYERHREIATYSSVGLAPVHIAALFIAESAVFAVLGAVLGYLLGQVTAKVLQEFNLLVGLSLNYSSGTVVVASLIVMAVVMLSAIYPSRLAAKLAVPDVTRRWRFPEPDGARWAFEFPFTVADWQVLGLFAFLAEYFEACGEESIGSFYARDVRFVRRRDADSVRHIIELDVWLAPYDLGVSQHVRLVAEPGDDAHIHHIRMHIERRSGEDATWRQRNRAFLGEIRRQFLLYRTLSPASKQRYEQRALARFGLADAQPDAAEPPAGAAPCLEGPSA